MLNEFFRYIPWLTYVKQLFRGSSRTVWLLMTYHLSALEPLRSIESRIQVLDFFFGARPIAKLYLLSIFTAQIPKEGPTIFTKGYLMSNILT